MVLLATKPKGADGARAERVLETISIACNKNTLPSGPTSLKSRHLTGRHECNQSRRYPRRRPGHDNPRLH